MFCYCRVTSKQTISLTSSSISPGLRSSMGLVGETAEAWAIAASAHKDKEGSVACANLEGQQEDEEENKEETPSIDNKDPISPSP